MEERKIVDTCAGCQEAIHVGDKVYRDKYNGDLYCRECMESHVVTEEDYE